MNRLFTLLLAASCLTAVGQVDVTYPYNPDGNADTLINVLDLQDLLVTYGQPFLPSEIMVDDSTLTSWIEQVSQTLEQQQALINSLVLGNLGPCQNNQVVQYHGYSYPLVEIGDQCWFGENLKTTTTRDSVSLPQGFQSSTPAWNYYNGDSTLSAEYGLHYNYTAALELCPYGWHLPTDIDIAELKSFLLASHPCCDGSGKVLKVTPSNNPSWDGTDSYGFGALPGGFTSANGTSYQLEIGAWWWAEYTGVEYNGVYGDIFRLETGNDVLFTGSTTFLGGQANSVRCIKDTE